MKFNIQKVSQGLWLNESKSVASNRKDKAEHMKCLLVGAFCEISFCLLVKLQLLKKGT